MRLGLRAQIGLILIGLTGLVVALIGFPGLGVMSRAVLDQQVETARRVAALTAGLVGERWSMQFDGRGTAPFQSVLGAVAQADLIEAAQILDAEGLLLVALHPGPSGETWRPALSTEDQVERHQSADGRVRIRVQTPVMNGETVVGYVRIETLLDAAAARGETARLMTALLGAMALVVVAIVGYVLLTWIIVSPIRRMAVATQRVAEGDFASRVDLSSHNEIGELALHFNRMVERIEESRRVLEAQVTAVGTAKRELEQAQSAIVRSEKLASVGRLAAGVAHEVGNPLAALLGLIEILRDDTELLAADRQDMLQRMERELTRISDTIRRLLDYSRRSDAQLGPVVLDEVVTHARKLMESQPRAREITFSVTLPDLPPVRANADGLLQVLVNLLLNAVDAVSGKGRIDIVGAQREGGVELAVTDSGPGVPAEALGHVFEPFFTTKPTGQGTGLGLAICDSIVQGLGGRIEVEPGGGGRGATFRVWLPRA